MRSTSVPKCPSLLQASLFHCGLTYASAVLSIILQTEQLDERMNTDAAANPTQSHSTVRNGWQTAHLHLQDTTTTA
jgi:hypothetical protein